ncbi:MAG: hypothetical protein ACLTGQ_12335 [Mediterraneibacter gnavus]
MNPIKVLEWKGMYPIKKIILLSVWLFAVLILYASFVALIKDHDFRTIFIIILDSVGLARSFIPIKKYVLTSYHCMPFFNEIFTKKELEELLENEVFQKMTGSKENPLNKPELLESENWFCIHGKFISKNITIIGRAWVAASLNNKRYHAC